MFRLLYTLPYYLLCLSCFFSAHFYLEDEDVVFDNHICTDRPTYTPLNPGNTGPLPACRASWSTSNLGVRTPRCINTTTASSFRRFATRSVTVALTMKRQFSVCRLLQNKAYALPMHLFLNLETSKLRKQTQVLFSDSVLHGLLLNFIAIFGIPSRHVLTPFLPTADSSRCPSLLCSTMFPFYRVRDWFFFSGGFERSFFKCTYYIFDMGPASWSRSNDPTITEQLPTDLLDPSYAATGVLISP
jgi:hypothetical protein